MRVLHCAAFSWALVIAGQLCSGPARAQDAQLSVAVRYVGTSGCDDDAPFWRALSERTTRVSPSDLPSAQILLDVQLKPSRRGVLGTLQIVRSGFATEPRYVEAQRCEEVVQALALTAALGIDPDALTKVPENEPLPEPETESRPGVPWNWRGTLEGEVVGTMAVDLEANWGVFAAVGVVAERASYFAPKIRLGATATRSALFDSAGHARFTLSAVTFDACPVRFGNKALSLRPCASMLWGALVGEGTNLTNPLSTRGTWLSLGPSAQLEIRISDALQWQVDVAATIPLLRQRYYLGLDAERIAATPGVMPWLGLGLSYTP